MIDPVFYVFVAVAILSYGIQSPLNVLFSRRLGALRFTVYRNLSLAVTMAPVLLFAPWEEVLAIHTMLPVLLLASATGAFGFICLQTAARYLPVGITQAIRQAVYVTGTVILGALFFGEYLTLMQLLVLAGVLLASVFIMVSRSNHAHLDSSKHGRGVMFSVVAGVSVAFSFYFFSQLSRELNPLVAGYFWEATIGVLTFAYMLFEKYRGAYVDPITLPLKEIGVIALMSLTTISGTLGYAYAVNYGPFALASGLVTSTVLISAVVSWFLFKERLTMWQVCLILIVTGLMILLRFISG
ncbi:DMT family transporter [Patescibacteria group bacterium]|nr:DMT family transporter [Patescibacteria group bacterium]